MTHVSNMPIDTQNLLLYPQKIRNYANKNANKKLILKYSRSQQKYTTKSRVQTAPNGYCWEIVQLIIQKKKLYYNLKDQNKYQYKIINTKNKALGKLYQTGRTKNQVL